MNLSATKPGGTGYATTDLAADVLALLDALGLDRASVAGHDVGGRVGFHLGLFAPDRIERLLVARPRRGALPLSMRPITDMAEPQSRSLASALRG